MNNNSKLKSNVFKILEIREVGAVLPLLIAIILFSLKSDRFLSADNIINILRIASFTLICATGETYLLISGSWDISIGAVYSLGGVMAGLSMSKWGLPVWLSVIIALAAGALVGVLNGFLVQKVKIAPFIATIGTQFLVRGLIQGITGGSPVYPLADSFLKVGQGHLKIGSLKIPWVIIIALILSVVASIILKYTVFGRKIFAVGGNGEAAHLAGIQTGKIRFCAFVLTGITAALTGILMASRLGSAQIAIGNGFEMTVIAGAVIGGISMNGGAGSIFGMALGAVFMAMITNGMTLVKISANWQLLVTGAILIVACSLEFLRTALKKRIYRKGE